MSIKFIVLAYDNIIEEKASFVWNPWDIFLLVSIHPIAKTIRFLSLWRGHSANILGKLEPIFWDNSGIMSQYFWFKKIYSGNGAKAKETTTI